MSFEKKSRDSRDLKLKTQEGHKVLMPRQGGSDLDP